MEKQTNQQPKTARSDFDISSISPGKLDAFANFLENIASAVRTLEKDLATAVPLNDNDLPISFSPTPAPDTQTASSDGTEDTRSPEKEASPEKPKPIPKIPEDQTDFTAQINAVERIQQDSDLLLFIGVWEEKAYYDFLKHYPKKFKAEEGKNKTGSRQEWANSLDITMGFLEELLKGKSSTNDLVAFLSNKFDLTLNEALNIGLEEQERMEKIWKRRSSKNLIITQALKIKNLNRNPVIARAFMAFLKNEASKKEKGQGEFGADYGIDRGTFSYFNQTPFSPRASFPIEKAAQIALMMGYNLEETIEKGLELTGEKLRTENDPDILSTDFSKRIEKIKRFDQDPELGKYFSAFVEKSFVDWFQKLAQEKGQYGSINAWTKEMNISLTLCLALQKGSGSLKGAQKVLDFFEIDFNQALNIGKNELEEREIISSQFEVDPKIEKAVTELRNDLGNSKQLARAFGAFLEDQHKRQPLFSSRKKFCLNINISGPALSSIKQGGDIEAGYGLKIEKARRAAWILGFTLEQALKKGLELIDEKRLADPPSDDPDIPSTDFSKRLEKIKRFDQDPGLEKYFSAFMEKSFVDWFQKLAQEKEEFGNIAKWTEKLQISPSCYSNLRQGKGTVKGAKKILAFLKIDLNQALNIGKNELEEREIISSQFEVDPEIEKAVTELGGNLANNKQLARAFGTFLDDQRQNQTRFSSKKEFCLNINISENTFYQIKKGGSLETGHGLIIKRSRRATWILGFTLEQALEKGLELIDEKLETKTKSADSPDDSPEKKKGATDSDIDYFDDSEEVEQLVAFIDEQLNTSPLLVSEWLEENEFDPDDWKDLQENKSLETKKIKDLIENIGILQDIELTLEDVLQSGKKILENKDLPDDDGAEKNPARSDNDELDSDERQKIAIFLKTQHDQWEENRKTGGGSNFFKQFKIKKGWFANVCSEMINATVGEATTLIQKINPELTLDLVLNFKFSDDNPEKDPPPERKGSEYLKPEEQKVLRAFLDSKMKKWMKMMGSTKQAFLDHHRVNKSTFNGISQRATGDEASKLLKEIAPDTTLDQVLSDKIEKASPPDPGSNNPSSDDWLNQEERKRFAAYLNFNKDEWTPEDGHPKTATFFSILRINKIKFQQAKIKITREYATKLADKIDGASLEEALDDGKKLLKKPQ